VTSSGNSSVPELPTFAFFNSTIPDEAAFRLSAVDAAVRKLDLPSLLYPISDGGSNIPNRMRIRINRRNAA
jgi:hypothetical protein